MCVSFAGSRSPPPTKWKTSSPCVVDFLRAHSRLIAEVAIVREHELVTVAMINGHHFHFFTREDGFHEGAAAGREMVAHGTFLFCLSLLVRLAISQSPASPLKRSKAESTCLVLTDVLCPECRGLSAATEANRTVPTPVWPKSSSRHDKSPIGFP